VQHLPNGNLSVTELAQTSSLSSASASDRAPPENKDPHERRRGDMRKLTLSLSMSDFYGQGGPDLDRRAQ